MDVQGFDDMDAMFAAMNAAEDAANDGLLPAQVAIRDAVEERVYWVRAIAAYDLVIYGEVPPSAETQKRADFDVAENRQRGYLTGVAYSAAVGEDGEPGDTHVSQVIPIDAETFTMARGLGFPDFGSLTLDANLALARRLAEHEKQALGRP